MGTTAWKQTLSAARGAVRAAWRQGMGLVLPPRCALCDVDFGDNAKGEQSLCAACRASLSSESHPVCPKCGASVPVGTQGRCPSCAGRRFAFERAFRGGIYEGPLRDAVLRAKNLAGEPVAAALGQWLAESVAVQSAGSPAEISLVTCVPAYWLRRARRGTNSAAVIAQALAGQLQRPAALDLLVCRKNIEKQSSLSPSERRRNVRGAFRLSWGYDISGAVIMLVDDVMTTGATAHEVARVLRQAGAARVLAAVVARAQGPDW